MTDVKVNSKHLLKVPATFAYIYDKALDNPIQLMIHECDYVGDAWRITVHNAPGYPTDHPLVWQVQDQHLMLTDDNRYILHDRTGKMLYLSFYKETPISQEVAYSEAEVAALVKEAEADVFIEPGYIDTASLTEVECNFLRNVAIKSATPMLDGTDQEMLSRFSTLGLLMSKGGDVGGGHHMVTYWMKKEYHKYFESRPLKFRPTPNQFNTQDLIEVHDIHGLGTSHERHDILLIQNDYQGKPEWTSRIVVRHVKRINGAWELIGDYRGFLMSWKVIDQDVVLSDRGVCAVLSEGRPYLHLQFIYTAPVTPSIMQQVISGVTDWDELGSPEQR